MCLDIFRRPKDAVRRKRPEKWRTYSWFLLRDNAPAHRSGLVRDFLAKNNVSTPQHPPYSADSYLFCRLTSALKGRCFCDATDISGVPRGVWGVQTPPPNSEGLPPKSCQTQPHLWKLLKIAEFRKPTPQDVRKKGSKILKLPRFAIVLH